MKVHTEAKRKANCSSDDSKNIVEYMLSSAHPSEHVSEKADIFSRHFELDRVFQFFFTKDSKDPSILHIYCYPVVNEN